MYAAHSPFNFGDWLSGFEYIKAVWLALLGKARFVGPRFPEEYLLGLAASGNDPLHAFFSCVDDHPLALLRSALPTIAVGAGRPWAQGVADQCGILIAINYDINSCSRPYLFV